MKTKYIDNLELDIIASFEKEDQEWFTCFIQKQALESEYTLISYIKTQLGYPTDLVKLSLCWKCDEKIVTQYNVIKESIKKNAKYYFENGELL